MKNVFKTCVSCREKDATAAWRTLTSKVQCAPCFTDDLRAAQETTPYEPDPLAGLVTFSKAALAAMAGAR